MKLHYIWKPFDKQITILKSEQLKYHCTYSLIDEKIKWLLINLIKKNCILQKVESEKVKEK